MTGPAVAGLEGRWGFAVTVPDSWYEIDLEPATRDESIRRMVEERARGNDTMWQARHGTTRVLQQQARAAWEAGAAYAAGFAMPTDDGPITGAVTVSLVRGPVGAREEADPVAQLLERLEPVAPTDDGRFTRVTAVRLDGAGECARSYGIEDTAIDEGYVRTVFMQTMVPMPTMNKVFLVSCSSPVVPLAAELHDLFDAVTGSFRLVSLTEGDTRVATH